MGQKVHPLILRIGYIKNWRTLFRSDKKEYVTNIQEDYKIRRYIRQKFAQASVSQIIIERLANQVRIRICSVRPGVIIGRRGADIDKLKEEIKNPAIDAQLIAQNIAFQLEKRVAFKRAMKRALEQAMTSGGQGVKISCAGRLGGAEMSR